MINFTLRSLPGHWPTLETLDIGAMPEGIRRFQRLIDLGLASVTSFEPQAEQRARLGPDSYGGRVLSDVLGDGRPGIFHVTHYPGCTSLLEPDPAVINMFHGIDAGPPDGNFTVIREESVNTRRLDDIDECPMADYVKIDVQGAELLVLENGTAKIADAVVIDSEVEFVALYKNQPLFGEIQVFMRAQHFMFHKFIEIAGRTFRPTSLPDATTALSQGLWADAIFVKDFSHLECYSEKQLLKAAVVLHEVYASFDLVRRLLLEYDCRSGEQRATAYWAALQDSSALQSMYMSLKTSI